MSKFYISYTRSDRDWAVWIAQELEKLGHTPHIYEWEISAGGNIVAWMEKRLDEADHIICVVSRGYLNKDYSSWERQSAQWAAVSDRWNFALPVYVQDCKPPMLLAPFKRCDLYGIGEAEAAKRLAEYLKPASRPEGPIVFPGQSEVFFPGRKTSSEKLASSDPFVEPEVRRGPLWKIIRPERFVGYEKEYRDLAALVREHGGFVVVSGRPRAGRRTLVRQVAYDLRRAGQLPGGAVWIDLDRIHDEAGLAVAVADELIPERSVNDLAQCQGLLEKSLASQLTLVVLNDTANRKGTGFAVDWARRSIRSPSCAVYIPCSDFPNKQRVWLQELDPVASVKLFCDVLGEVGSVRDPDASAADPSIGKICTELHHHPQLIEVYAKRSFRDCLALSALLKRAKQSHSQDANEIWDKQLAPLFDDLSQAHHDAFLRLGLFPAPLSEDVIEPLSGIDPSELGPYLKDRCLWQLYNGKDFEIDVYVRDFARSRWPTQALADAEAAVRRGFADLAVKHDAEIDVGLRGDRDTAEDALNWFESQWPNLLHVYFAEAKCKPCNSETLFAIADSLVLFMIRRGHLADCERIFRDAVSQPRDDQKGFARTLNDLAVCLQFKGKYLDAEEEIKECIKIRRDMPGEQFPLAQSLNTAAAICFEQVSPGYALSIEEMRQALKKALAHAEEAQELCNAVLADPNVKGEARQKFEVERSQTLSNIGVCHSRLAALLAGQARLDTCKKARQVFEQSLKFDRPNDSRQAQTLSRRGWLYLQQDFLDLPRARVSFKKALDDLAREPVEHGRTLWGLGRASLQEEPPDTKTALGYLHRARDEFLGSNPHEWIGVTKDMAEALRFEDPPQARQFALDVECEAETHYLDQEKVWASEFITKLGDLGPRVVGLMPHSDGR